MSNLLSTASGGAVSVDLPGLAPAGLAQKTLSAAAHGRSGPGMPVIDCAVHPRPRPGELQRYMPKVWQHRRLPAGERYYYPNPVGDYLKEAYGPDGPPGSDPALVSRHLFDECGISQAILLPLTLGLLPDIDLLAAICSATNAWLADTWLSTHNREGRFRGTIRVSPTDPRAACWTGCHPCASCSPTAGMTCVRPLSGGWTRTIARCAAICLG